MMKMKWAKNVNPEQIERENYQRLAHKYLQIL